MILLNFSWLDSRMNILLNLPSMEEIPRYRSEHWIAKLKVRFIDEGHGQCWDQGHDWNHQYSQRLGNESLESNDDMTPYYDDSTFQYFVFE